MKLSFDKTIRHIDINKKNRCLTLLKIVMTQIQHKQLFYGGNETVNPSTIDFYIGRLSIEEAENWTIMTGQFSRDLLELYY